jgi:hypothetical protein
MCPRINSELMGYMMINLVIQILKKDPRLLLAQVYTYIYVCMFGRIYMCVYNFSMGGLYDEKFRDTDIEKGPETIIGPGIYMYLEGNLCEYV